MRNGTKRADNGTVGESRTKAFLIDRFWILERSVDIEGADFLVQRKLQDQSILNNTPPRFGIIQSKFSQDEKTSHQLKMEYVLDSNKKPHVEFFLIVNLGYEDSQKMFVMSAKEIVENFNLDNKGLYRIPSRGIISKFEVKNKKDCLDYMESSIQYAEFYKNRMYVFNELDHFNPDLEAIEPDFTFDIENGNGSIPDIFKEQKIKAYKFILEIEKIHRHLISFVKETNPIEASYIAQSFNHKFEKLQIPQVFEVDFYYQANSYLEQIKSLQEDGILKSFLSLKEAIRKIVNDFLQSNQQQVEPDSHHIISIQYDTANLGNLTVANKISSEPNNKDEYFKFRDIKEGSFKAVIFIGLHIKNGVKLTAINEICLNSIVQEIYYLKYFENNKKR